MRNSQQPPKYGAEGPPGGAEEWNRQRFARTQPQIPKMFRQLGEGIRNGPLGDRMRERQQSMTQPRPWTEVPRTQWGSQQQMPPSGAGPQPGMGIMPTQEQAPMQGRPGYQPGSAGWINAPRPQQQTGMAGLGQMARGIYDRMSGQPAMPGESPAPTQPAPQQQQQQTGMAGLGQAAARISALRNRGRMQEQ